MIWSETGSRKGDFGLDRRRIAGSGDPATCSSPPFAPRFEILVGHTDRGDLAILDAETGPEVDRKRGLPVRNREYRGFARTFPVATRVLAGPPGRMLWVQTDSCSWREVWDSSRESTGTKWTAESVRVRFRP